MSAVRRRRPRVATAPTSFASRLVALQSTLRRGGATLCLALVALGALAPRPASAALRYEIGLHDLDEDRREPLQRLVAAAEADVQAALRTRLDGTLRVDFAGSDEAFRNAVHDAGAGSQWSEPWIAGLALLDAQRVIVRLDGPGLLQTSETVRHELAHVAIHALSHGRWLPRWYHESVAMFVAGEATADRLRGMFDAGIGGTLTTLDDLQEAFAGNRLQASHAYATASGFLRFAVRRSGNSMALADLHERMHLGLDFEPAWIATFGLGPRELFALYAGFLDSAGSRWAILLGDTTVWSIVSLLFILSLVVGWRRRPRFEPGEPMDLEAIAAAGEYAMRTGRMVPPLDGGPQLRSGFYIRRRRADDTAPFALAEDGSNDDVVDDDADVGDRDAEEGDDDGDDDADVGDRDAEEGDDDGDDERDANDAGADVEAASDRARGDDGASTGAEDAPTRDMLRARMVDGDEARPSDAAPRGAKARAHSGAPNRSASPIDDGGAAAIISRRLPAPAMPNQPPVEHSAPPRRLRKTWEPR